jgi:hypothetical protein
MTGIRFVRKGLVPLFALLARKSGALTLTIKGQIKPRAKSLEYRGPVREVEKIVATHDDE